MLYDLQKAQKAHKMLVTLKNRTALKILDILKEKRLTVTDIYVRLWCNQSTASQFLRDMYQTGILKCEKYGKFIYYSINKKRYQLISDTVNELSDMYDFPQSTGKILA